jgi:hypothetical protein
MNTNKICPECNCEYLPHVETCADCGAALIHCEELQRLLEEQQRVMDQTIEDAVVVREGDLQWLGELYRVLIGSGIACSVQAADCCGKGCKTGEYRLMVPSADAERASERIEEYFAEIHPEVLASRELMGQGKCPACGSPVNADDRECPDCGLTLVFVDEEGN